MIIKNLVRLKEVGAITTKCYSLEFDGVAEYVNCTNNAVFDLERTDSFSMAAWVNVGSYSPTATEHVISKYSNPPATGYFLAVIADKITVSLQNFGGGNGIIVSTVNTFNTGQWYHITVTYDGSSTAAGVKIYVDGVSETISIAFDTLTGSILTSEVLKIGGNVTPVRYFEGKIASARMWNVELSSIEALTELSTSSPVGKGVP